jgi:hypothetical protein
LSLALGETPWTAESQVACLGGAKTPCLGGLEVVARPRWYLAKKSFNKYTRANFDGFSIGGYRSLPRLSIRREKEATMHRLFSRSLSAIALFTAFATFLAEPSCGSAADGQPTVRVVKKTRGRGRLPNYYANVVTEQQKDEIYKIQEEYKPKIDAAKAQLDALKKELNEKISAVLTADQKKKVEEAEAVAKAAKKPEKEKADKPADKTPERTAPTPEKPKS